MADIRIKDLATTAASTASDDFVAVDGSANGTRKLNAYSPTFGGNLTVSGTAISLSNASDVSESIKTTGTANAATLALESGNGTTSGRYAYHQLKSLETSAQTWNVGMYGEKPFSIRDGATSFFSITNGTGAATLAGNLTVSGTGTSSVAGALGVGGASVPSGVPIRIQLNGSNDVGLEWQRTSATNGTLLSYDRNGSAYTSLTYDGAFHQFNIGGANAMRVAATTGNLLLGTTTDIGYKLYVKGSSDAQAMLDVASGSQYTSLAFANAGTGKGFVYWDNSNNALFTGTYASSAALKFNTGLGVLALTLDSSQHATFAGVVQITNAGSNSSILQDRAWLWTADGLRNGTIRSGVYGTSTGSLVLGTGASLTTALTLDSSQNATFAGAIAIGNTVNTVSPTSPNRTITMVIGGTTYYIHAKTTND